MERTRARPLWAGMLAACVCGCHGARPRPSSEPAGPAASPEASRPQTSAATVERARSGYTSADVQFVQGMIHHHAQALAMTALIPARTSREDLRLLGQRIDVSQTDEIATMQRWLRVRGERAPDPNPQHMHHLGAGADTLMPGMLTPEEMERLATAKGAAFDRLFLQLMIRHHEGALRMVAALFATPASGQEAQLFEFASDVDADQRAEIARMKALLARLPNVSQ